MEILKSVLSSLAGNASVISLVVTALVWLLRTILKDKFDRNQDLIEKGIEISFHVVEDIAAKTPNKIDDKAALGLSVLLDYLKTHKVQVTPSELERAKLVFSAMNAATKPIK